MTVGKIFSSPSKPDQAGIVSLIHFGYKGIRLGGGFGLKGGTKLVAEIFYFLPNMLAPLSEIVSHEKYVKQI